MKNSDEHKNHHCFYICICKLKKALAEILALRDNELRNRQGSDNHEKIISEVFCNSSFYPLCDGNGNTYFCRWTGYLFFIQ